ncbi:MAG: hypothetical protein ACI4KR_04755 [Ruminiclostridium sp.]
MSEISKLAELFSGEKDDTAKIIGDYIIWQLDRMNNRELAEKTAEEFTKGIFKLGTILEAVRDEARTRAHGGCAVMTSIMTSIDVFEIVRRSIRINGAVTPEETVGYNPFSTEPAPAPTEKTPASVDFGALWD